MFDLPVCYNFRVSVFVLMIIVADEVTASLNNSQQCTHTAKVIMMSSEVCLEASHSIVYVQR